MTKRRMKWAAGMLLAAGLMAQTAVVAWASNETFVPGTSVNGLGISGLTVAEASQRIADFYNQEYTLTIREKNGKEEVIRGSEIGFSVAMPEGFLQGILDAQNAAERLAGPDVDNSHRVTMQNQYDAQALADRFNQLDCVAGAGQVITQDARVSDYQAGEPFTIIPEVDGNNVDREKTAELVRTAVAAGQTELDLEAAGCYVVPQLRADSPELTALCALMNQYLEMSVTYTFGEQSEILGPDVICSWITGSENGQVTFSREKAAAYIAALAEKFDTAGKTRTFHTATGKDVSLTGPYGWKIDQAAEADALLAVLAAGQSQTREPVYASTAVDHTAAEWGNTYVEVDLTGQHVYMVKEGAVVWDAPCVTGNLSKNYDTPEGIYGLYYKQRDKVLRGAKRADGTYEYESPVSYWMPFNGGIGLHDANWRGTFGGEIYKTNGSHGCVNLPPSKVPELYEMVYKGIPIFCYF